MNFGDILDAWDEEQKVQKKKAKEAQKSTGGEWRTKGQKAAKAQGSAGAAGSAVSAGKKPGLSWQDIALGNPLKADPLGDAASKSKVNPMNEWMRRYGVVDKDAAKEEADRQEAMEDRETLLAMPYEATIDLHGLTTAEANARLDSFVTECRKRDLRKILIIHGKGNHSETGPVLSGLVRSFIERDWRLGESGHPDKYDGGKGATWVIIRKKEKNGE